MGWGEMMLIGVVALIVVGPKDLPMMFHSLGRMSAKARKMAREFSSAMSDAAESSGASDLTQEMRNLSSNNLGMGNSLTKAADAFDKWDPTEDRGSEKKMGPETAKLSAERKADAEKIRAHSAKVAQERLDREAAEAAAEVAAPKPAPKAKAKPKAKDKAAPKAKAAAKTKAAPKPKAKTKPKDAKS